jgi:endoglucanase
LEVLIGFLKDRNFNAVRVPFSAELALNFDTKIVDGVGADSRFYGKTGGQAMDMVFTALTNAGILVMPVMQHMTASGPITDNWYTPEYPPDRVIQAWKNMVTRYKSNPGVFAVDLKNEPHGATKWTEWIDGVNQMSRAIQEVNPNLLIFVEGVEDQAGASGKWWAFWGGIIAGAQFAVPEQRFMSKIVFSPHIYPPPSEDGLVKSGNFPNNMPEVWEDHFGKIVGKYAVVVGEWGGTYVGYDRVWHDKLREYLASKGLGCSTFYWALNPNGSGTGGLMLDDWKSPNQDKIDLLARTCPSPTKFQV